jgi:hypothetical protein
MNRLPDVIVVGAHQRRREVARSQATQPRRGDVERDHALDLLRMLQREQKRRVPAPVVSQEADAVSPSAAMSVRMSVANVAFA